MRQALFAGHRIEFAAGGFAPFAAFSDGIKGYSIEEFSSVIEDIREP